MYNEYTNTKAQMKTFIIDNERWILSKCGMFVRLENSGWYALTMFNKKFQARAKQAESGV